MVSKKDIEAAWERLPTIRGKDPDKVRRDETGKEILKSAYGTTKKGNWQIDHRNPLSRGGSDDARNLRALNTKSNQRKSDK
jgi:5-methylcytosine-specific restriction endonuclease McrA